MTSYSYSKLDLQTERDVADVAFGQFFLDVLNQSELPPLHNAMSFSE